MFEHIKRLESPLPTMDAPRVRLKGTLCDLPSAFELALQRDTQKHSGKIGIYSHPGYWRHAYIESLTETVGEAAPLATYATQNRKVKATLSRMQQGKKYALHEENFERYMHVSVMTGMDLIITIPCREPVRMVGKEIWLTPGDGGKGHFSNWLGHLLLKVKDQFANVNGSMWLGRIAFYPTNYCDGKLLQGVSNFADNLPPLGSTIDLLREEVGRTMIIPGGGFTHRCAQDSLNELGSGRNFFTVPDLLYTDDPGEGSNSGNLTGNGLFLSCPLSDHRKTRLKEFFGNEDG